MNVRFASTRVTLMRGSMRLMKRAQVAPPNPPPTTTTRAPAPCAMAGSGSMAAPAAAALRNSRRFVRVMSRLHSSILLRAVPGRDGFDLVFGKALGYSFHDCRWTLSRLERLHGRDDVRGIAADESRHGRVRCGRARMTARTGGRAGRRIRQSSRRSMTGQDQSEGGNTYDACGVHTEAS